MKSLLILATTLVLQAQTASAAIVRCSDEKTIVVLFNDNTFNPDSKLPSITDAEVYRFKPMETVLLEKMSCGETSQRGPADERLNILLCERQGSLVSVRLFEPNFYSSGKQVAVVSYPVDGNQVKVTLSCK